jgi:ABC-type transporter Mla subunit MlaD
MKHMPEMLAQTRQTMEQIQVVLKQIEAVTAQLPKTVDGVQRTVDALPGLILQTEESLRQAQRLTEAAQRSWLVRPYMDQPDASAHIAPERVGGGRVNH